MNNKHELPFYPAEIDTLTESLQTIVIAEDSNVLPFDKFSKELTPNGVNLSSYHSEIKKY